MNNVINIKRIFPKELQNKNDKFLSMASMLRALKLKLDGTHHSGIDDSKNIAKIVYSLINNHDLLIKKNMV